MPADQTIDMVLLIVSVGLLTLGLGSIALGWLVRVWDRAVNHFQIVMPRPSPQTEQTAQTDRQTDYVSEADHWLDRMELDRTKRTVIELMVYVGWDVGQIRNVIKGDNGAIGAEIDAAKKRLGMVDPPRALRVRDEHGERIIPMDT